MRIGTVLSTCIHDIVTGIVPEDEVLIILDMIGYDFSKDTHLEMCWHTMTTDDTAITSWKFLNKQHVFAILKLLNAQKKFHHYMHSNVTTAPMFWTPWLTLTIPNENLKEVPMLQQAWDEYLFLAKLIGK